MSIFNYDHFLLLWIAIMGVISSGAHIKVKENVLGVDTERYRLWFAILLFTPIFLLVSVWDIRHDMWQYLVGFDTFNDSVSKIIDNWSDYKNGQGFLIIESFIKQVFGNNQEAFRYIVALMQSVPIVFILRKYSENYIFSIFLFITMGVYNSWMMNGIRQFLAVCVIFAATPFLIKRKYAILLGFVILATTIHQSAIIMVPCILIVNFNPWKKSTWALIVILAIVLYFYVENSSEISEEILLTDDGANPLRIFFSMIPILLFSIRKDKIIENQNKLINICIVFSLINTCTYFIAFLTSGILTGRLPIYFELFNLILIPYLVNNLYENEERKILYIALTIIYLAYFEIDVIL